MSQAPRAHPGSTQWDLPSRKEPFLCIYSRFLLALLRKPAHRPFFAKHISNFSPVITLQHHGQVHDYHCTPGGETETWGAEETESKSGSKSPAGSCFPYTFLTKPSISKSGIEMGAQGCPGRWSSAPLGPGAYPPVLFAKVGWDQ